MKQKILQETPLVFYRCDVEEEESLSLASTDWNDGGQPECL
ncbi:MAG: hypothetical protein ACRC8A_04485 [Microcoleaceae cyanobacterium]